MSQGTLGGIPFTFDPTAVAWRYTTKTKTTMTVGGKVVQAFGTTISDMVVKGFFGSGGTKAQAAFLAQVEAWVDAQTGTAQGTPGQYLFNGPPIQFVFPPRDWNFPVYITNYSQSEGGFSIELENQIINYPWELTLMIVNSAPKSEASATLIQAINKISANLGWYPNPYQGQGMVPGQYLTDQTLIESNWPGQPGMPTS